VPRIFTQEHEAFRNLAREILGREGTPFRTQDTSELFFTTCGFLIAIGNGEMIEAHATGYPIRVSTYGRHRNKRLHAYQGKSARIYSAV
jgi:hypothetical protein